MAATSTRFRLRLAALSLLVAGTAVAHEKATGIVAARMKAMEDTAAQAKALDRALKASSPDDADLRARAERIHALAHDLHAMFPPGSDQGHTYARPEIWTQRDGFQQLTRAYDAATERLVEAAGTRTLPALRQQFTVVRRHCLACHERFRTPGGERGY
ncbi:cytochrome c [Microvirga sp. CF3062]|uniref:c-type cytochrome n=1 Tax=Microvirga sp. CF3062 TaxID=3110182 RepID=UPI002E79DEFF|nr:cytochrome c [Microvirga sp. CF3062]MEE1657874.1 cytochrome c [Microvirga sp. CF3062]